MPTYDYRCQRTGEMFEKWQSFGDTPLTSCILSHDNADEPCGAPVKKVFSKVGISFKGEGFYKNDHGANARARASEKSKSESASSEAASSDAGTSTKDSSSTTSDSAASSTKSKTSSKASSKDSKTKSASNAA